MTLRLEIDGIDRTSVWRVYESRWTMRAWNGEAFASEFIIDDDGSISHADLTARKIVEVWEDASGSDICLYRGRISNKHLGMSAHQTHNDMRWTIEAEDANIELRGIRVNNAVRDVETDEVRFEAMRVAFLNGSSSTHAAARDSTTMGNTYLGQGVAVNLEAETYTDTDPLGVFNRIVEVSGRTFFVTLNDDGTMELYYGDHTDESYKAVDIELTDAGEADGADGVDIYAVYKGPNAGEHAGQNVMTGGALRWGDGQLYEQSDIDGGEAIYDKWEETYTNEFVQHTTQADNILHKLVNLSDEDFTYLASIDVLPENAHRFRAGMMVLLTRYRANKPTQGYVRIVQCQHEPVKQNADGETLYRITMDLGRAQGRRLIPRGRHKPGPHPPAQPVAGTCTRWYFSSDNSNPTPLAVDSGWDVDDAGAAFENNALTTSPDGTYTSLSMSTGTGGGGGVTTDVALTQHMIVLDSDTAASLAAGGATIKAYALTRTRTGIGISESSQKLISQISVRVTQGNSTTIRGTALPLHSLTSAAVVAGVSWPAVDPNWHRNRVFPPAAATNTLSAVSGAAAGDYLVIELGYRNFTVPTATGGTINLNATVGADDLPEDTLDQDINKNSWVELCTGDSPGDETEPTVLPGEGSAGTGTGSSGQPVYVGPDHTHSHGNFGDEGGLHNASDIDGLEEFIDAEVVDHGAMGASEDFDFTDARDHEGELDANLTVTLSGATSGEAAFMTLKLTQDSGGGNTLTLPGSVVNGSDVETAFDLTADAVNIMTVMSYDGGTTWYAFLEGTTSGGATDSAWIVDPGAPSYSGSGPVTVALTSKFGIDSGGNPYYNAADVTDGEEAALVWDSVTGTYLLRPYYP